MVIPKTVDGPQLNENLHNPELLKTVDGLQLNGHLPNLELLEKQSLGSKHLTTQ